jgi:hypothetical protein
LRRCEVCGGMPFVRERHVCQDPWQRYMARQDGGR